MKRFTLMIMALALCLAGHATVNSVDDLVGNYIPEASGWEAITDYNDWTNMSLKSYSVNITKNDDGTVTVTNPLGFSSKLVGTVDLAAKTITFAPQTIATYYTFADINDQTQSVVATFDDDCNISFSNFGAWYNDYSYIYAGATLSLSKNTAVLEWQSKGTLYFYDDEDGLYLTANATIKKYSGTDAYDYGLAFDHEGVSPAELQFKIEADSIVVVNGKQYDGYTGAYIYNVYEGNLDVWFEYAKDYTHFEGTAEGGKLYMYHDAYNTSYSATDYDGYVYFYWGTYDGISAVETAAEAGHSAIYDLSGRQVSHPAHGLYIRDGKKFVVK